MTICPKECPDRHPGCHDHCERYAENKAAYQKNVHERAVKLRKMTDDKLVEHIDHIREEAYNTGYSEAEAQRASTPAPGKTLPQLLEQLDAGECKGIKSATAYKIAEFAREQGYLE